VILRAIICEALAAICEAPGMALPPRMALPPLRALAVPADVDEAHAPWGAAPSGPEPGERQAFFKPIHIVNELVTPLVEYRNWKEFCDLVYEVQDQFCACLYTALLHDASEGARRVSPVLGRVAFFPLHLALLRAQGPAIIMRLTKQQGLFWCQVVSHFVCSRALRAAAIFDDVRDAIQGPEGWGVEEEGGAEEGAALPALDRNRFETLCSIMQQEVRHTFSGAMPFSIYTLCSGFISTLLVKNFTFYDDRCLTAFSHRQFDDMLLTLCMGLHPRLGQRSPLLPLDADLLRLVCAGLCASQLQKHIVFHTQEQWLY
jgi:hypothetical protein